ncbi:hypothetical protein CDD81_5930 [Ophiocordyceps australis]|uniref:Uncharacterized protein n=1 Tax=Ophiocordyceps australis TaxID=1399860 RepID=A0A2C5XM53_9HYPO|nr:hypothetical protein CDD81_5930 [Ophiocordyceps australis]
MAACVLAGTLLYAYTFLSTPAVAASAFSVQSAMQGAFSAILALSPAAFIQSSLDEKYVTLDSTPDGTKRYEYSIVISDWPGGNYHFF